MLGDRGSPSMEWVLAIIEQSERILQHSRIVLRLRLFYIPCDVKI
jgi:hypothetical protein